MLIAEKFFFFSHKCSRGKCFQLIHIHNNQCLRLAYILLPRSSHSMLKLPYVDKKAIKFSNNIYYSVYVLK